jgi:hypothetical protein
MERGNSLQMFEEVDSPPVAQRHWTGDRALIGIGPQLHTGGISMGSLHHPRPSRQALPEAQAGSLGPMVEQTLVHVATTDVEGRANILLRQLEDANHLGVGKSLPFYFLPSFFYISFLIVDGISCVRGDCGARGS